MSGNVYMQWVEANSATIRATLIVLATFFAIGGFCASFTHHWHASATVWTAAFLCKCVECWLLEKALVECQEAL